MQIAALLVTSALAIAQQGSAPADRATNPERPFSIERIRKALEQAAGDPLTVRPVTPDFVVHIRERERFKRLIAPPWDLNSGPVPPGGLYAYEQLKRSGLPAAPALLTVDLIAVERLIADLISNARDARATRAARDEVRRAVAGYCAAQPEAGVGIQICATPSAIH